MTNTTYFICRNLKSFMSYRTCHKIKETPAPDLPDACVQCEPAEALKNWKTYSIPELFSESGGQGLSQKLYEEYKAVCESNVKANRAV
ncbi:hypothetical protein [Methylogaea oryzae]|uniref:Uncharacterized protein n=1 Tax=Methylogaea oryzae TaxID=1295382 RepID=A0A8D5AGN1_9GAMM|nr:hypothetical protein [Methylogaea oryzae]BBL70558.1 hypothetical protein MoryE10_11640 [Methylogaea oryzae]